MTTKKLIEEWFKKWEDGDFLSLPISNDFVHTSPFGKIEGKSNYIAIVEKNKAKFLGYDFQIHDAIYNDKTACVRYTGKQDDFSLDVSEWYYCNENVITEIIAYYHIGDIRSDRELEN